MADLRGADSLLQKAIKNVDSSKKTDTAEVKCFYCVTPYLIIFGIYECMIIMHVLQDVQLCIQEQRASMKEVLEDTRLVTLQREGGALLAKMRKEEFRFPQSEDYRYQIIKVWTHLEMRVI